MSETTGPGNTGIMQLRKDVPLISPKSFSEYSPEEYQQYVMSMYALRVKGTKPKKPTYAEGLAVSRTKKGSLSIRLSKAKRAFAYVLRSELDALAKGNGFLASEVWNAFKEKKFIIAETRMDAERIYAEVKNIPF